MDKAILPSIKRTLLDSYQVISMFNGQPRHVIDELEERVASMIELLDSLPPL
jgi:hypothetical protein